MENLGFKEGTARPKRERLTRGSSSTSTENGEAETTPLTQSSRFGISL